MGRRYLVPAFLGLAVLSGCSRIFAVGPVDEIDFTRLELADSPNQFLMCPVDHCKGARPHRVSPVYAIDTTALRSAWEAVVLSGPRTTQIAEFGGGRQVAYVQRSAVLGFPDVISVLFLESRDGATFAIYSRSVFGHSDFGVNKARIDGWLERLEIEPAPRTRP